MFLSNSSTIRFKSQDIWQIEFFSLSITYFLKMQSFSEKKQIIRSVSMFPNMLGPGLEVILLKLFLKQRLNCWRAFLQSLDAINLDLQTVPAYLSRFYNQYLGLSL